MSEELIRKSEVLELIRKAVASIPTADVEECGSWACAFADVKIGVDNMPPVNAVELPCKVGDLLYRICPQSKHIQFGQLWDGKIVTSHCQRCPWGACDCYDIGYQKDLDNVIREIKADNILWIIKRMPYFGKHYFMSKTEAERALEDVKDEKIY